MVCENDFFDGIFLFGGAGIVPDFLRAMEHV
jgi:hypothetical protein